MKQLSNYWKEEIASDYGNQMAWKGTCSTRLIPEATTDPLRKSWIFSINQSSKASPIPSCRICLATQKALRL